MVEKIARGAAIAARAGFTDPRIGLRGMDERGALVSMVWPLAPDTREDLGGDLGFTGLITIAKLDAAHNAALDFAPDNPGFPLTPLVRRWLHRPRQVNGRAHKSGRPILPIQLAMTDQDDLLPVFNRAAHTPLGNPAQIILPGFAIPNTLRASAPLELFRMGRGKEDSPGPGAPWPLRLFIEPIFIVPPDDKEHGRRVSMPVTLRQILTEWLYPKTPDTPNRRPPNRRQWESSLKRAIEILDSTRIPVTINGRHYLRRVVELPTDLPSDLDEPFQVVVHLTPGSHIGPQVSPNLRVWGVNNAAAYRMLLQLPYQWWDPGNSTFPVKPGGAHIFKKDIAAYPVFTDAELVALAYPRHRRQEFAGYAGKDQRHYRRPCRGQ